MVKVSTYILSCEYLLAEYTSTASKLIIVRHYSRNDGGIAINVYCVSIFIFFTDSRSPVLSPANSGHRERGAGGSSVQGRVGSHGIGKRKGRRTMSDEGI